MTTLHAGTPSARGSLEPWLKDDVKFYGYQVEGVRWLKNKKGALLADDMGLGKTLQILGVFAMHIWEVNRLPEVKPVSMIVVCPVSLRDNWMSEIDKFTRIPAMLLEGTPAKRKQQLEQFAMWPGNKILVLNYEQVAPHIAELNGLGFTILCADEAHTVKNHKAKRTKAFQELRARRRFMVTGTPILRYADDLWVLLDKISPGQWGTYWSFTHKYCVMGGFKGKQVVGIKNEQQLINKLNDVMLRRNKKDELDLPEVQFIRRSVRLNDRQRALYNEIAGKNELDREDGAEPELIDNDMVKMLRLRQVCATTATVLAHGEDSSSKLDLAVTDMVELIQNGHKVVVFTQFREVVRAYRKRLEARPELAGVPMFEIHGDVDKKDRLKIVNQWSNTDGPAIIMGITKVMGVGLNMTAARHAQFIDKEYAPGLNTQAVDRLNRIGASETQSIQVFEYYVMNSAEVRVEAILRDKGRMSDMVVDNSEADFQRRLREALSETV